MTSASIREKAERLEPIIHERFPGDWTPPADNLIPDDVRVAPDLELRMVIHPQPEEMKEIVEVDLPICLGISGKRQILSSLLSCDALLQSAFVRFAAQTGEAQPPPWSTPLRPPG